MNTFKHLRNFDSPASYIVWLRGCLKRGWIYPSEQCQLRQIASSYRFSYRLLKKHLLKEIKKCNALRSRTFA